MQLLPRTQPGLYQRMLLPKVCSSLLWLVLCVTQAATISRCDGAHDHFTMSYPKLNPPSLHALQLRWRLHTSLRQAQHMRQLLQRASRQPGGRPGLLQPLLQHRQLHELPPRPALQCSAPPSQLQHLRLPSPSRPGTQLALSLLLQASSRYLRFRWRVLPRCLLWLPLRGQPPRLQQLLPLARLHPRLLLLRPRLHRPLELSPLQVQELLRPQPAPGQPRLQQQQRCHLPGHLCHPHGHARHWLPGPQLHRPSLR